MDRRWVLFALICLVSLAHAADATDDSDDDSFAADPILQYRPSFACSLPIQILMTGIVVTLTSVLFIHLIFTAQYHWPLAPVNYALQLSAVITLMVSLVATLHVVLDTATKESRQWPYMLNYIAVDIPPLQQTDTDAKWRQGELAAWLLMNATTSALIQITHIQFLTLLFPSSLERRLIFVLLGPLAIVSAVMQLVPINDSTTDGKLTSIASAVQNVCNATLSLLFTASLFIWGLFVNRKQAWRTDGGTAAFGAGALTLALVSTVITFIYIPSKDHYVWMPGLMWAVILWQSFLGWWWWVGSGMGVGEVDEILRREEKRRKKRKARSDARQMRREKAQTIWRGVTGALGCDPHARRRSRSGDAASGTDGEHERHRSSSREGEQASPTRRVTRRPSSLHTASSSAGSSSAFGRQMQNYAATRVLYGWYLRLRHAHLTASREQAEENAEKIQQVYGREGGEAGGGEVVPGAVGWGLGMYGLRQMRDDGEREEGLRGIVDSDDRDDRSSESSSVDIAMEERHDGDTRRRRKRVRRVGSAQLQSPAPLPEPELGPEPNQPSSIWYWGPLRRWRLRDSTVYS